MTDFLYRFIYCISFINLLACSSLQNYSQVDNLSKLKLTEKSTLEQDEIQEQHRDIDRDNKRTPSGEISSKLIKLPKWLEGIIDVSGENFSGLRVLYPINVRAKIYKPASYLHKGDESHLKFQDGIAYKQINKDEIRIKSTVTKADMRCFYVFISGGYDCYEPLPLPKLITNNRIDLLDYSRQVTKKLGLVRSKEMLIQKLSEIDSRGGRLEADFIRATRDKFYKIEGNLIDLPEHEKKQIGFFFIFGLGLSEDNTYRRLIKKSADSVSQIGFSANVIQTQPSSSYHVNSKIILKMIKEKIDLYEKIILVAASKGVADSIVFFLNHSGEFSNLEREKFKLMISLSGVNRESVTANWFMKSGEVAPAIFRNFIALTKGKTMLDGFKALSESPWKEADPVKVHINFNHLKWISISMIPDRSDGLPSLGWMGNLAQKGSYQFEGIVSPSDGLMETAATILPPLSLVPQEIIRGFGDHGIIKGKFIDGSSIAPMTLRKGKKSFSDAGVELLDSMLRVLDRKYHL